MQGSACGSGPQHPGLPHPEAQETPEPQSPGASGVWGESGLGDPDSLGPQRSAGSPGLRDRRWRASPVPAQTGFLATFRTKCQVQVQVQRLAPGGKGWGSHPQLPLFSGISALTSPSRAGLGRYPRPAPPRPAGATSSRPHGACAWVPATLLKATERSGDLGQG